MEYYKKLQIKDKKTMILSHFPSCMAKGWEGTREAICRNFAKLKRYETFSVELAGLNTRRLCECNDSQLANYRTRLALRRSKGDQRIDFTKTST